MIFYPLIFFTVKIFASACAFFHILARLRHTFCRFPKCLSIRVRDVKSWFLAALTLPPIAQVFITVSDFLFICQVLLQLLLYIYYGPLYKGTTNARLTPQTIRVNVSWLSAPSTLPQKPFTASTETLYTNNIFSFEGAYTKFWTKL